MTVKLPEWVKNTDDLCCVPVCDTKLIEALTIAIEALERVHADSSIPLNRTTAGEALIRIERLGDKE